MQLTVRILIACLILAISACREDPNENQRGIPWVAVTAEPRFDTRETRGILAHDPINEASGLAASRQNPGVLWTHNDSGNNAQIFALSDKGKHLGVFTILGAENRDWEDIAVGPGPQSDRHYLYIGDTGDNKARYEVKTIYRLPEPRLTADQSPVNSALNGVESIRFRYPDGKRDAETLIVDPLTRDIYIVSKREDRVHVYRAAYPQFTNTVITLEKLGELTAYDVTAGDISPSGREILIKAYNTIKYWQRKPGQSIWETLQGEARRLPYEPEPQGEAIAWASSEEGYYTLSEERDGIPAFLYFYPRLLDED
jgi:hypothetical protein